MPFPRAKVSMMNGFMKDSEDGEPGVERRTGVDRRQTGYPPCDAQEFDLRFYRKLLKGIDKRFFELDRKNGSSPTLVFKNGLEGLIILPESSECSTVANLLMGYEGNLPEASRKAIDKHVSVVRRNYLLLNLVMQKLSKDGYKPTLLKERVKVKGANGVSDRVATGTYVFPPTNGKGLRGVISYFDPRSYPEIR